MQRALPRSPPYDMLDDNTMIYLSTSPSRCAVRSIFSLAFFGRFSARYFFWRAPPRQSGWCPLYPTQHNTTTNFSVLFLDGRSRQDLIRVRQDRGRPFGGQGTAAQVQLGCGLRRGAGKPTQTVTARDLAAESIGETSV